MGSLSVIRTEQIAEAVCRLYREINTHLRDDVREALEEAREREDSDLARDVLDTLLENERISRSEGLPLCQDTGLAVAFADVGRRALLTGCLQTAVDEGVGRAQRQQPLRASVVENPLRRENTGDNTPAIVHLRHVEGSALRLRLMAKGGGAENMSRVRMLAPGRGREGVVEEVVASVRDAGANACPPVIVGVGLGGNFEISALLAKRALLRDLREPNPDAELADLEAELLERLNALGIGPQGFGGRTTALGVLVESAPCHIASLPVAINIECHSHRHGEVTLLGKPRKMSFP
ncbi:MAG: fumarate hydratase [Planctomycetota bacterium]